MQAAYLPVKGLQQLIKTIGRVKKQLNPKLKIEGILLTIDVYKRQDEMDAMMYKIEGEDLYLIGTSEHSMIGKFIDTITPESELPKTCLLYTSKS